MKNIKKRNNKNKVNEYPISNHIPSTSNFFLVNTVENNKSFYTKKQVKLAEVARRLQQNMGFPGNDVFKRIIQNNLIQNCPITVDDFTRALKIFGTSESILKGRMTAPSRTSHNIITTNIPKELKNVHQHIQLYVDLCYINGLAFMIVISDKINYLSIDHMKNKTATVIMKHLKNIILKYTSKGFNITNIFGDGEFNIDDIVTSVLPATLHICSADEHVSKVERAIRTVK